MAACVGSPASLISRAAPAVSPEMTGTEAVLADDLAALAEGVHVAVHGADLVDGGAGQADEGELDAQEVLRDDV